MKLCLISDTHNLHSKIVGMENADVLIHAGDITGQGKYFRLQEFNNWLAYLNDLFPTGYQHKIVIPGNHDLTFESDWETAASILSEATVLNQTSCVVNGLKIYGEPRQPEFFDWAFNVPRPDMRAVWEKAPSDVDILVTHGPPHGVGDKNSQGAHVGCVHLLEYINQVQPRLVVCGHIHEGYGIYMVGRTVVVNAAICTARYHPTNRPIYINI